MAASAPTSAPTTAERIRSACVRADGAMLAVAGGDPTPTPVHHLLDDGSFVVAAPDDGAPGTVLSAIACAGVSTW